MNYEPTNWQTGDLITAGKLNHLEQGIAAFYPQETVIAPEQTVTITSETDPRTGVPITLAEGYTLPETLPDNWTVVVDGEKLPYVAHGEEGAYEIFDQHSGPHSVISVFARDGGLHLVMMSFGEGSSSGSPMIGDHTVKITKYASARIPAVAAFPVSAGSGSVALVIEAPAEEVDAAMVNGCVLLYAASPSASSGFAFGCLVGNVLYSSSVGQAGVAWFVSGVTLRDGKYVVLGES